MKKQDLELSKYFCPNCHFMTLSQHTQDKYRDKWNKCPSCGYMEEKTKTDNRAKDRHQEKISDKK